MRTVLRQLRFGVGSVPLADRRLLPWCPFGFFDDSDDAVMKIQITPGDMLSFAVAEPGAQQKL